MLQLGVAGRVLGNGGSGIRSRGTDRSNPVAWLSYQLLWLRDVLLYLAQRQIRCFRIPETLLPPTSNTDANAVFRAIEEAADLCGEVGLLAQQHRMRLSMHPGLHVALGADDPSVATHAGEALALHVALLDALGCGPEGVVVVHVGGSREGTALDRFAMRYDALPIHVRRRIVVEADEHSYDLATLMWLRRCCGVPLVFDSLHFQLNNPSRMSLAEAVGLATATWPTGTRPKIHVSTQRTEAHIHEARGRAAGRIIPPRRGQHADFINPFEFAALVRATRSLPPFDIMLEAKAADLAVLRLRDDIRDLAPDIAGRVG